MPTKTGQILEHPITGEKIVVRQSTADSRGAVFEFDMFMKPHGFVAAEHIHPLQEERFEVVEGSVVFSINGVRREAHAGENVIVSAGTPHVWWNESEQEAQVKVEFEPALSIEAFFETFFGLAQDGKVNKKSGLPNVLRLALISREFRSEVRLAKPPVVVQNILFMLLGFVGRVLGYRGRYPYPR